MPNPSRVYTCGDLAVRNQPICNIGYIKEPPFFKTKGGGRVFCARYTTILEIADYSSLYEENIYTGREGIFDFGLMVPKEL